MNGSVLRKASSIGLCVSALLLVLSALSGTLRRWRIAQPGRRAVEIDPLVGTDAVQITDVAVGARPVVPAMPGEPVPRGGAFQESPAWLERLSFSVRNRTGMPIDFIRVDVCFPQTRLTGPMMCAPLRLGRIPDQVAYSADGTRLDQPASLPLGLGPGQRTRVLLSSQADSIRTFVEERQPFSGITECFIHPDVVYFADAMKWEPGCYWIPDSLGRGRWNALNSAYFPGALGERRKTAPPVARTKLRRKVL